MVESNGINVPVIVELKPIMSLWAAIKIRIAGFKHCEINKIGKVSRIILKK